MIKSELKLTEKAAPYPALCKDKNSSLVILFNSERSGTVVVGNQYHKIGKCDQLWTKASDDSVWQILPTGSQIILEQQ